MFAVTNGNESKYWLMGADSPFGAYERARFAYSDDGRLGASEAENPPPNFDVFQFSRYF